jgi:hypothetical protein
MGVLHEDLRTDMITSRSVLIRKQYIAAKLYREDRNRSFLFNSNFLRISCHFWDNMEKYGTAGQTIDINIIWRMRFVCWISKATNWQCKTNASNPFLCLHTGLTNTAHMLKYSFIQNFSPFLVTIRCATWLKQIKMAPCLRFRHLDIFLKLDDSIFCNFFFICSAPSLIRFIFARSHQISGCP